MNYLDNEYFVGDDIIKICNHFADRVISTNIDCYQNRKQYNLDKIRQDIVLGKIAEWGVYFNYLHRGRTNIGIPDMNIYQAGHKNFDADLKWGFYNLHIKSQTFESAERFGDSWIFQAKDPLFDFSNEYDIIVGCRVTMDTDGCLVQIKLEKPFRNLIFGDTRMSKFAGNKKAVYLKDNNEEG